MPGAEPQRGGSGLARRLRGAFAERLPYKAAALFFSIVLWLVVRAEEPTEALVPVRVEAAFDSMRALSGPRPAVRAVVVGRPRDLIKLYDRPPVVRRAIGADAPDSIRLDLRPADVFLPAGIDAEVRDVQPRAVWLTFDVTEARRVPVISIVRITVDSAFGVVGAPRIEPESVTVTGRRSAVWRVSSVQTRGVDVVVRDTTPHLVALDTAGLGVRVRPGFVSLRVPRGRP